jgi:nucleoside-diphosphate kinase
MFEQKEPFTFALVKSHIFEPNISATTHTLYDGICELIKFNHFKIMFSFKSIISEPLINEFYKDHRDAPYWKNLKESISGPVAIMLIYSDKYIDVISAFRSLVGATNSLEAEPGTIRNEFGDKISGIRARNAIHASDSKESFLREMALFYGV